MGWEGKRIRVSGDKDFTGFEFSEVIGFEEPFGLELGTESGGEFSGFMFGGDEGAGTACDDFGGIARQGAKLFGVKWGDGLDLKLLGAIVFAVSMAGASCACGWASVVLL